MNFPTIFADEFLYIKFPLAASVVHIANFPKDLPLRPGLIMNPADAPHHAHEPIWIVAIQSKPVVQPERLGQRFLRGLGPLQHLLGPVHPEEAVQLAFMHQLQLGSVPQIVCKQFEN